MIKQIIILRKDLGMRLGKASAQSAHASMKVFFDRIVIKNDAFIESYIVDNEENIKCTEVYNAVHGFTTEMIEWMQGSFAKIVVGCNSEAELLELRQKADEAGIVNALILDEGRTEFYEKETCLLCNGQGHDLTKVGPENECKLCGGIGFVKKNKQTYTALAIGPDDSEKIDKITGELKLL